MFLILVEHGENEGVHYPVRLPRSALAVDVINKVFVVRLRVRYTCVWVVPGSWPTRL